MFLLRNVKNSEAYLLLRVNKNTLRCHFDIFSLSIHEILLEKIV